MSMLIFREIMARYDLCACVLCHVSCVLCARACVHVYGVYWGKAPFASVCMRCVLRGRVSVYLCVQLPDACVSVFFYCVDAGRFCAGRSTRPTQKRSKRPPPKCAAPGFSLFPLLGSPLRFLCILVIAKIPVLHIKKHHTVLNVVSEQNLCAR